MKKTGESYTAARAQVSRAAWVKVLDAENSNKKTHGEIARYVSSIGTPDWWSQMVTVGYERIGGLRDRGQRLDGWYEISKSRTFGVPNSRLYAAFTNARTRRRWLPEKIDVRSASANKRMRIRMADGTVADLGFIAKSGSKSTVALPGCAFQGPDLGSHARASAPTLDDRWHQRFLRAGLRRSRRPSS